MSAEEGGSFSLSTLPLPTLNQALFSYLAFAAGSRLATLVPLLLSSDPAGSPEAVALNTALLVVGLAGLASSFAKVDYAALPGLDVDSFAREAGEWALAGEVPAKSKDGRYAVATFAGGCFWGTELYYQRIPGVVATCVGYTQGAPPKPTYEAVCGGRTGHTEGVQIIYDPAVCPYERLLETLFDTVKNPTLLNQVGNDRGTQYRHGIYTHDATQAAAAARKVEEVQSLWPGAEVVTEVKIAEVFWPAEAYHQQYLQKKGQSAAKDATEKVRCYG